VSEIKWSKKATALVPLKPLVKNWEQSSEIMNGWPVFEVSEEKAVFDGVLEDEDENELEDMIEDDESDQDEDSEQEDLGEGLDNALDDWPGDDMGLGGDLDDLDLDSSEDGEEADGNSGADLSGDVHVFVQKDNKVEANVNKNSILAADFAAIGRFDLATEKLSTQVGILDGAAMKKSYLDIYMSSQFFTSAFDFIAPSSHYITKEDNPKAPFISNTLKTLEKKV
jgi:hypothetical protein